MEEVELPPLPPSQTLPHKSSRSVICQKRSRTHYEPEPATSSDPALFSSDDPAPSAEQYSAKRRKDNWRGTWWGDRLRGETAKEKRQFKRNYDSGIWMGSESTESSLEEEFLSNQRDIVTQDSFLHEVVKEPPRAEADELSPLAAAEHAFLAQARTLVQECVDAGIEDVDLSSALGGDLPTEILQPLKLLTKHSAIREPPASQEAFKSLEADMRVYLANNALTRLPAILFEFSNLRVLSLRHNDLTEIPPAIGRLTNLESLNVSNNKLRYLPYELLELTRFGKLAYLVAEPNPFMAPQPSERCKDTVCIPLPRVLPLQKGTIHHVRMVAESMADYFRHDGTPIATSRSDDGDVPTGLSGTPSTRSLTQIALLNCCKQQNLADLPEWLLDDLPPTVRKLLDLARDVQESGGRLCTKCHKEMVIPRKQWTEWWSMGSYHAPPHASPFTNDKVYPFLRRQCGLACTEDI